MAQQHRGIDDYEGRAYEESADVDDEDDVPVLSQGSTVSNASSASAGGANKRRFELDEESEEEDVQILGLGGRAIAVPRRIRRGAEKAARVVGQENLGDVDFEDAEFLDYGLVGGGDEEMGGV